MGSLPFSSRAVRTAWRMAPKRALSGAIGWGASRGIPGRVRGDFLARFARSYGIDATEAERPLSEYATLDEFFTRRLHPHLRPIDPETDTVVSPADGTVIETGLVREGQLVQVKGILFELDELLADADAARRLDGGAYLTTYLSPRDYHRVHSPISGSVIGWEHVPGTLFPVGAKSVMREPGLFIKNERLVTLIEGDVGLCAVVMVAAVGVGNITAAYDSEVATHEKSFRRAHVRHRRYDVPRAIAKGDEVGTFHLGSTTVVVFEPGRVELARLEPGSATKMGQAIGRSVALRASAMTETG